MVEYVTGDKGCGKTSILIKKAVELSRDENKTVLFIDNSNDLKCLLPCNIRYINSSDYDIIGAIQLYGFLTGLCASNYDITDIFVDGTLKIIGNNQTNIDDFMSLMNESSNTFGINFHFSYCDEYSPDLINEMLYA